MKSNKKILNSKGYIKNFLINNKIRILAIIINVNNNYVVLLIILIFKLIVPSRTWTLKQIFCFQKKSIKIKMI